jgi:hypothetical protein
MSNRTITGERCVSVVALLYAFLSMFVCYTSCCTSPSNNCVPPSLRLGYDNTLAFGFLTVLCRVDSIQLREFLRQFVRCSSVSRLGFMAL